MRVFTAGFVCFVAMLAAACTMPVSRNDTIPEHIQNAWVTAYNNEDPNGVDDIYAEDCMLWPPSGEVIKGREVVVERFRKGLGKKLRADQQNFETKVDGDLAYRVGTFRMTDASGIEVGRGKYLEIWRRERGNWKLVHDIWNSEPPVASATESDPSSTE